MPIPSPPPPMRFVPNGVGSEGARDLTAVKEPNFEVLETSSPVPARVIHNAPASAVPSGTQRPVEAPPSTHATGAQHHPNAVSSPPLARPALAMTSTPASSSSSSSSQQVAQLWQLVQDLTAENAVLQQRVRVLMEGETHDATLPGILTAPSSPEETEALLLRIRRLEAALKVEAMEREALEVRLQAQEQVLTRLLRR
ncbi:hypothetical protein C3747_78g108 [Trypanosoma cruzi]|uniref:Uncharacterized protein n=2 Tax=Trypanosoma cruzi TaxID=5693 RepID=Q4E5R2_TRYCC|nr:hypothetical protein, conserved [Trypanosoma cruzi]EAO00096.1 hypothetical protein, conserved [Trypanosoma cruzi]PWV09525.1 hypothetical protein C3747_78g108 [Trypanosoma cruzi]|eukprot:XP_821947.1 hypothetical protein [Trypanosoma cruzi strain CL Brener]